MIAFGSEWRYLLVSCPSYGRCLLDYETLDSSVGDSLHLEDVPTLFDLITHFRYSAEVTEDEFPNRLDIVALESSIEPIVYILDWNPTIDDVCPVGLPIVESRRRCSH